MHALLQELTSHGVPTAAAKAIVVVVILVVASLVSRLIGSLVERFRAHVESVSLDSPLVAIARRETAVALTQTAARYVVFFIALVLAITTVAGGNWVSTVAGASFIAVIIAFAAQRFLIDLMAGFVMFFEGWYTVGSTVVIEPMKLEGVVEEMSLRATTIRDVSGDPLHVHNSQISAVRVLPDGARRVDIELFVRDRSEGERLLDEASELVPVGPTAFLARPEVRQVEELGPGLCRITATASVTAGRVWLAEELLPSLIKERAQEGALVHGPVVLPTAEAAIRRFRRAERRSRRAQLRA